jgi:hypothetical protein
VEVSFIGGRNWSIPGKTTDLLQVTDKLYLKTQFLSSVMQQASFFT